jgi:hypothetical protein
MSRKSGFLSSLMDLFTEIFKKEGKMSEEKNFNNYGESKKSDFNLVGLLNLGVTAALLFVVTQNMPTDSYKSRVFIQENGKLDHTKLKEGVCKKGMLSILSREVSLALVNKDLATNLIQNQYEGVGDDFIETSTSKMFGDRLCRFVSQSDDKFRAFHVELDLHEKNEFIYKIFAIDEVPMKEGF